MKGKREFPREDENVQERWNRRFTGTTTATYRQDTLLRGGYSFAAATPGDYVQVRVRFTENTIMVGDWPERDLVGSGQILVGEQFIQGLDSVKTLVAVQLNVTGNNRGGTKKIEGIVTLT